MAFGCGVCVYGLGGVYARCGWGKKLVLHWVRFFKKLRFNSPASNWFCIYIFALVVNSKTKDVFLTFVHIMWLVWVWKLLNTYLPNEINWSNVFLFFLCVSLLSFWRILHIGNLSSASKFHIWATLVSISVGQLFSKSYWF
jgi:hypothetical protein